MGEGGEGPGTRHSLAYWRENSPSVRLGVADSIAWVTVLAARDDGPARSIASILLNGPDLYGRDDRRR